MDIKGSNFKKFRNDFASAVKQMEADFGVTIKMGGITYEGDGSAFHSKVTVRNTSVNGVSFEQNDFNKNCGMYGFEKSDYNREFTMQGERLRLVGFNLRAPKNSCSIVGVKSGSKYKCSESAVKRAFNKA
jgi:hypothetical protein